MFMSLCLGRIQCRRFMCLFTCRNWDAWTRCLQLHLLSGSRPWFAVWVCWLQAQLSSVISLWVCLWVAWRLLQLEVARFQSRCSEKARRKPVVGPGLRCHVVSRHHSHVLTQNLEESTYAPLPKKVESESMVRRARVMELLLRPFWEVHMPPTLSHLWIQSWVRLSPCLQGAESWAKDRLADHYDKSTVSSMRVKPGSHQRT